MGSIRLVLDIKKLRIQTRKHPKWKLEGLNLDDVYENLVRQIAGDKLQSDNSIESLKQSVERDKEIETLQKQINILQGKIRKEKQLNKQMEMNTELKKLRKALEII